MGWFLLRQNLPSGGGTVYREYLLSGSDTVINSTEIYVDSTFRFGGTASSNLGIQLNTQTGFIAKNQTTVGGNYFIYNGTNFILATSSGTVPYYITPGKIYPILGSADKYIALSGSTFFLCDITTMLPEAEIVPPAGYTLFKPFSTVINTFNQIMFSAYNSNDFRYELLPYNVTSNTFETVNAIHGNGIPVGGFRATHLGGLFVTEPSDYTVASPLANISFVDFGPVSDETTYMVLQRRGADFHLVQEESYPIRIDISNSSPLLTVGSGDNSFASFYITGSEVLETNAVFGLTTQRVEDYRYSLLEPSSGISGFDPTSPGMGVAMLGMYVYGSGIFVDDLTNYSGFQQLYSIPSGYGNRMETSNAAVDGQYVFVTTSGDFPMFWQKDPTTLSFVSYSGLPQSRATIIRLDDYI
jgi:hypothetical protein